MSSLKALIMSAFDLHAWERKRRRAGRKVRPKGPAKAATLASGHTVVARRPTLPKSLAAPSLGLPVCKVGQVYLLTAVLRFTDPAPTAGGPPGGDGCSQKSRERGEISWLLPSFQHLPVAAPRRHRQPGLGSLRGCHRRRGAGREAEGKTPRTGVSGDCC